MKMKPATWCKRVGACCDSTEWCKQFDTMADAWDACPQPDGMWRLLACRFVREVWREEP